MLIDLNGDLTPICFKVGPLGKARFEEFNRAINALHAIGAAPTFATTFRKGEFDFLDKLKVNLKTLLHTEQEYQFVTPFQEGDSLEIETKLASVKQRRGMAFVSLESDVKAANDLRLRSISTFVLRETVGG